MSWNYIKPSIVKIGDVYEYCVKLPREPSCVYFGEVIKINKENKTLDFERLHNTCTIKDGKPYYVRLGLFHHNVDAVRRAISEDTWK